MFSKGQGTTEYLVILSIVIVIALVVVGVMGWFPGLGPGLSEKQSKAYWQTTGFIALQDWKITKYPIEASFVVENRGLDKISVTEIIVDGTPIGVEPDVNIAAGSKAIVTGTTGKADAPGAMYQYDVQIEYDVIEGISGKTFVGQKPIVGICIDSECSCVSWSDDSCGAGSCSAWQMQQTRSCSPSACESESSCTQCTASCCNQYCVGRGSPSGSCRGASCLCEMAAEPIRMR